MPPPDASDSLNPAAARINFPGVSVAETQPKLPPIAAVSPIATAPDQVKSSRYLLSLEQSIEQGIRWAVFEPDSEPTWARVRQTISDFLYGEWRNGRLMGAKPEEAYFVTCDRTTMTQSDIDNGRLLCLVGVATIKPAEFVIFRISQMTASQP